MSTPDLATSNPLGEDKPSLRQRLLNPSSIVFVLLLVAAFVAGQYVAPQWTVQRTLLNSFENEAGEMVYAIGGSEVSLADAVPEAETPISEARLQKEVKQTGIPESVEGFIYVDVDVADEASGEATNGETTKVRRYYQLVGHQHWGIWSMLPAVAAVLLCVITREPLTALFGGVLCGAFLLTEYDITDAILLPSLQKDGVADVLLLYCGLLGGLLGIWSRTGSAKAFAEWVTHRFVTGPRSAKLVAWFLGITFFQGATISCVMVGSTVKPIADKERVSHEELSYVVDSTASPIAAVIAFNSWPAYVQAFLFVPGVAFLATEADRLAFFFQSVPLSFYGIFAVLGTFLVCIEKAPKFMIGGPMKAAMIRSRETGQLDAPNANPLQAKELEEDTVPEGFVPSMWGFLSPLLLLIGIVVVTFVGTGSPNVNWAFFAAFMLAALFALFRGMSLFNVIDGIAVGVKSVALAALILVMAMTIGDISQAVGGDVYLVDRIGDAIPFWLFPGVLVLLTMTISFATGTSWGTYALAFPLGMPLAWAMVEGQDLGQPQLYMSVCFAAILNGALFGDQCSPISDTTVLSAMSTGADLMDHVRTQIVPALTAMALAIAGWTGIALFLV